MKKIINSPAAALEESLLGLAAAHGERIVFEKNGRFIARRDKKTGAKTALISGGGSGHEPMHAGLVGNCCTSLEMAGASITVIRLAEEDIALWDEPVATAALNWGA